MIAKQPSRTETFCNVCLSCLDIWLEITAPNYSWPMFFNSFGESVIAEIDALGDGAPLALNAVAHLLVLGSDPDFHRWCGLRTRLNANSNEGIVRVLRTGMARPKRSVVRAHSSECCSFYRKIRRCYFFLVFLSFFFSQTREQCPSGFTWS